MYVNNDYNQLLNIFADCGKFFYVPESFVGHLKAKHGQLLSAVKCHVCRSSFVKIEQLLAVNNFYSL